MEYQIPQFVDEETKFVGPITLTQFWILLVPAILSLFTWFIISSFILKFFIIALLLGLGIALAFGKMNGVSLYKLASSAIRHFWLPKYYFWSRAIQKGSPKTITRPSGREDTIRSSAQSSQNIDYNINKNVSDTDIQRIAQALDVKRKK